MNMKDLFNSQLPGGERPDLQLCIFPHLQEMLVIDQRGEGWNISLLNASDVFTTDFFKAVEEEFSESLRAHTHFPFAHLINLPMQLEETIRDTVMSFILDRLGVTQDSEEFPTVIVFIVSGGALTAQPDQVLEGLKKVLRDHCGEAAVEQWQGDLSRLISEESAILQTVTSQELDQALKDDTPDYFTLWENRN
jgi:hypothetical protein